MASPISCAKNIASALRYLTFLLSAHVCLQFFLQHITACCSFGKFSINIYSRMEATTSSSTGAETTTPSAKDFTIKETPVCLLVLGMAGSGKTEFVKKLTQFNYDSLKPYTINLDPACKETPYPTNIGKSEIRKSLYFSLMTIIW